MVKLTADTSCQQRVNGINDGVIVFRFGPMEAMGKRNNSNKKKNKTKTEEEHGEVKWVLFDF